ncbi:hypothetical protein CLAVI_000853 [Candidatus Clavichlamydia salmonicola]|uniref:hypothetical protein n=1 Tax=Candidatus Clavichlamydia salmonicola TaxID=469812 RepID=UPI00189141E6|nr:hypothetical protein [Candidatus Clavichlamydia salmonicola]MBF5051215.1 hypothetical protein [Candidatus Clavichlamydia salmonicola]
MSSGFCSTIRSCCFSVVNCPLSTMKINPDNKPRVATCVSISLIIVGILLSLLGLLTLSGGLSFVSAGFGVSLLIIGFGFLSICLGSICCSVRKKMMQEAELAKQPALNLAALQSLFTSPVT